MALRRYVMAETQEKIELLKKIAHRFHAAQIEWALGASMMLYFKGLSPAIHRQQALSAA